MNIIINFEPKSVAEIREGDMVRTAHGATRVMSREVNGNVVALELFTGGWIQLGSHQTWDVMV